ncbi:ABC transporter permease [Nonomuraea zeae]|uniref:ABC transporter permease n=2 Tax=Nonomuraea zeae TaxID=1642303 RepID=A0A5S4GMY5_9ACTN|nr:ABC transporter permease [Nonomuraea zeae]
MAGYLLRRLGQAVFVLWAAYTVSFFVLFALPADPVSVMVGPGARLTAAELAAMRADLGLDRPLALQYVARLGDVLRGDLGESIQYRRPVTAMIGAALPQTAQIAGAGLALGLLLGLALALVTGLARGRWRVLAALPPLGVAVPSFWVGLLLLQQFSFHWRWFPATGGQGLAGVVLPAVTLALPAAAVVAHVLGQSLGETMNESYIDTARAKGASPLRVLAGHALRNAAPPALTMAGLLVGGLLTGSVVVETVFSRQGLGRLSAQAVSGQDLPLVQGLVLFGAAVFAVANLLVDLLHPLLDPRVRARG